MPTQQWPLTLELVELIRFDSRTHNFFLFIPLLSCVTSSAVSNHVEVTVVTVRPGGIIPCPAEEGEGCFCAKSLSSPTVSRLRSIPRRCSNSSISAVSWRQNKHTIFAQGTARDHYEHMVLHYQRATERTWAGVDKYLLDPHRKKTPTTASDPTISGCSAFDFAHQKEFRYNKSLSTITTHSPLSDSPFFSS